MKQPVRARIRRLYIPNAIYFITCVTHDRIPLFREALAVEVLQQTLRSVKKIRPFGTRAYVFLPDHLHLLLHILESTDISQFMHSVKRNFTLNWKKAAGSFGPLKLWQKGFWDHVLRDEQDYANHFHYIHYNPVKHGYVLKPEAWLHSSFHNYLAKGWYQIGWGHREPDDLVGLDLEWGE